MLAVVAVFGMVTAAHAGTIAYWSGVQPTGVVKTSVAIVANGSGANDGYPMRPATAKLYIDGVSVPRASFTASAPTPSSVYFYYNPKPTLSDGLHTFRVEMSDTAGKVSSYEWGAQISQPPNASWLEPGADLDHVHRLPPHHHAPERQHARLQHGRAPVPCAPAAPPAPSSRPSAAPTCRQATAPSRSPPSCPRAPTTSPRPSSTPPATSACSRAPPPGASRSWPPRP